MHPPEQAAPPTETIWRLTERVKELTALHGVARVMQDDEQAPAELLGRILSILPAAWQHPDVTEARIVVGDLVVATPGWRETPWTQTARFRVSADVQGLIEVCYTAPQASESEGPFLAEERALIDSTAEMVRRWFRHREADRALARIRSDLERLVEERSADLTEANAALRREVAEHRDARVAIERYQQQLRDMANSLCRAGELERRGIAQALHDHVGQSLAFARMRLLDLRGNAVFCGFEDDLSHVLRLLDGCLRYTRDLTCELSPPRLWELGLDAALEWLAESYTGQHKVPVAYSGTDGAAGLDEAGCAVLHAAAREFLANALRHGRPTHVGMRLSVAGGRVSVSVRDDGAGFDPAKIAPGDGNRFGLFSVRERLHARGGTLRLQSAPGAGTEAVAEVPASAGGVT